MIIKKANDILVFEFLLKNYYREFKIEELSKKTKLSIPKLYKTIKLFEKYALIRKFSNYIKINMNNIFVHNYKLLKDAEKFMQLKGGFTEKIGWAKTNLFTRCKDKIKSIIIFGSLASGEYNKESDIDLLIIKDDGLKEDIDFSILKFEGHVIQKTESELNNDLNKGDDFLITILKNNIIYFEKEDIFYNLMMKDITPFSKDLISEREKQLEILKKDVLSDIKKGRFEEGVDNFKKYIVLSSRIELMKYSLTKLYPIDYIPCTKNETLNNISLLKKEDIKSLYNSVNKNNLKERVIKYV